MFVGHAALALAAKRVAPRTSLGVFLAATFGLDYLWPLFTLAGLERFSIVPGFTAVNPLRFDHYPWSHSLLMAVVWGGLSAGLTFQLTRRRSDAIVVGALVVSHWLLDAVSHTPDLPLWPGSTPLVGFGLWRSLPATFAVEGLLFTAGVALYLGLPARRARAASWTLALLLVFMTVIWVMGPFSPPPPSTSTVSAMALALLVLPFWAARGDRTTTAGAGTGQPHLA